MNLLCLPLPNHSSFRLPTSTLFYIPTCCPWTLDDTLDMRRNEAAIAAEWTMECFWQEHLARQATKVCKTPRVLYGQPPVGSIVQIRLFEEVA